MAADTSTASTVQWSYPQRQCRVCMGEVDPKISIRNPNLPPTTENVTVTYNSPDEGRLMRPCKCKGSARYVHEKCLAALRAAPHQRWTVKCNECQFKYNTSHPQKYLYALLRSRGLRLCVTAIVMIILMFVLGFIADPVINLYVDPYETMASREFFRPLSVNSLSKQDDKTSWIQHFLKGFVSMGVLGFLKTALLANPLQYWNLRQSGMFGGGVRRGTTGRDRVANISWMAVLIGISTALYLAYEWLTNLIKAKLDQVAEILVETDLDLDDEDVKPPIRGIVDLSTGIVTGEPVVTLGNLEKDSSVNQQRGEESIDGNPSVSTTSNEPDTVHRVSEKMDQEKSETMFKNESFDRPVDSTIPSLIRRAQHQTWSFDSI